MSMWLGKRGTEERGILPRCFQRDHKSSEFGHMTANELSSSKIQGLNISFLSLSPNLQGMCCAEKLHFTVCLNFL